MSDNKLNDIISTSLESIRQIADAGIVMGDPIKTNNDTVIIPVSKVSLGFASGGVDYLPKGAKPDAAPSKPDAASAQKSAAEAKLAARIQSKAPYFGGGGGTGVSVTPVCFLVVKADGSVELLDLATPAPAAVGIVDSVSNFIEKSPDLIERLKTVFSKKKDGEYPLDPVVSAAETADTGKKGE